MTQPISRTPTFPEVLASHKESVLDSIHVAMPARVLRYDSTLQVVDVQPLTGNSYQTEGGERATEKLEPLIEVPVIFPGGGGFRVVFPISPGDTVLVIFADRSLDAWKLSGDFVPPSDDRRHTLSDAIAIPGLHSRAAPLSPADAAAGVMLVGKEGVAADFVALAAKVDAALGALKTALAAAALVPSTSDAFSAALYTALNTLLAGGTWPATVASATVKSSL